jgi:hypothetical protein
MFERWFSRCQSCSKRHVSRPARAIFEAMEPRSLLSTAAGVYEFGDGAASRTAQLTDADGTVATLSITAGKGSVVVGDDGAWHVTLATSARSSFTATAVGGDRRFAVRDLNITGPVSRVTASPLDVVGPGATVTFAGSARSVTLGNLSGATVQAAGGLGTVTIGVATDVSLTAAGAITSLSAASWLDADGVADTIAAPAVNTLKVAGNFQPNFVLGSGARVIGSATIGRDVGGNWSVAGSAGTIKLGHLAGNIDIAGSVANFTLADYVAVGPVTSGTGSGTVLIGGAGSVASRGEKLKVQGARLYAAGSPTLYNTAQLQRLNELGLSHAYQYTGSPSGKVTEEILPSFQVINGQSAYVIQSSGADASSVAYTVEPTGIYQVQVDFSQSGDPIVIDFGRLQVAPALLTLKQQYAYSAPVSVSFTDPAVAATLTGAATVTSKFAGHETVRGPAGTFLAAKLQTTTRVTAAGTVDVNGRAVPVLLTYTTTSTQWFAPGYGEVQEDTSGSIKMTIKGSRSFAAGGRYRSVLLPA